MFDDNALYRFETALKDNQVLTCSISGSDRNKLELYHYEGETHQKWAIRNVGSGKYAFFCAVNNGTMEIPGGNTEPCRVEVNKGDKQVNELW